MPSPGSYTWGPFTLRSVLQPRSTRYFPPVTYQTKTKRKKQVEADYYILAVDYRNTKHEATVEQAWNIFWNETLSNCPGPVLFEPGVSALFSSRDFQLDKVPRYLFRTYDRKSFGKSNEKVISSPASQMRTASSKLDIFSCETGLAMAMVDRHMNPWRVKDYERQPPDNFMSWTSSLLYAVQYALYRRYHHGCTSEEIKICVVDTKKFAEGQFIHAKRLLQAYYDLVRQTDLLQTFDLRLLVYIYQNGEYLSQGTLYHQGRSCLVSLAALEQSGLYSLYPEFAARDRQSKWAVTTAHFRKLWTEQHVSTTYGELEAALSLASACFVGVDILEMAVMFLSFKRRELRRVRGGKESLRSIIYTYITVSNVKDCLQSLHIPEWGRKPQEVRQYLAALHLLYPSPAVFDGSAEGKLSNTDGGSAEQESGLIQGLLRCFSVLL